MKPILIVIVILALVILSSGCTKPGGDHSGATELQMASGVSNMLDHHVSENIWYIDCTTVKSCDEKLTKFSKDHDIISIAGFDYQTDGKTSGYYVVTSGKLVIK